MAIDMPPFDDNRVRQAMRLIIDRQGMIDQLASGYGTIANDLYAPFDDGYFSRPAATRARHRPGEVTAEAGGRGRPPGRPAHHQRRRPAWSSSRTSSRRRPRRPASTVTRQERPQLLLRRLPQAGVLGRLLGHPRLPQPGAAGLAADLAVQRDALAAEVRRRVRLRRPVQAGAGRDRRRDKRIEIQHEMQQLRVRLRRLHHPVLQQPDRRLRRQGAGSRRRARAR